MAVHVRFITDPACPDSWAVEPYLRKLMMEFGDELCFTWVMGGLARDYADGHTGLMQRWLELAAETRMPFDPLIWSESPIETTYPACMAVKAATEQSQDGGYRYLRRLREGLMCFRRKLDTREALVEEARAVGLDVERFRIDLDSHAIVELFGADLEEARELTLPGACFIGDDGERHWVYGRRPYRDYAGAARAAGAREVGGDPPGVLDALERFGRMAAPEVEAVCELPEPRAAAELWRLTLNWKARPLRVGTGYLWELVS